MLQSSVLGLAKNAGAIEFEKLLPAIVAARKFRPGSTILLEGQASETIHLIDAGGVARYKTTAEGGRTIVWVSMPREFANLDFLWFDRVNYGLFALGHARALCISTPKLRALVRQDHDIANAFGWLVSAENMMLSERIQALARLSARERLLHFLCETGLRSHALQGGPSGAAGDSFDIRVTQAQLADLLGLTPVHVNRTIQSLIAEGAISRDQREWRLLDPVAAWREANFDPDYLQIYGNTGEMMQDPRAESQQGVRRWSA